jgi:hypothetical protein
VPAVAVVPDLVCKYIKLPTSLHRPLLHHHAERTYGTRFTADWAWIFGE